MRIIVCAAFYPPYRGGYAESVRLLAEGLRFKGYAVTVVVCGMRGSVREEVVGGVSVRRVRSWNPRFLHGSFPLPNVFAFWGALRKARREGVDIVSTQTRFFPSTFLGFLFAKLYGIPVVHTERGSTHPSSGNFILRLCGRIVDGTVGRLICYFSDGVIGVSAAASVFARRLGARNPVTVYNGIDADWWQRPEECIQTGAFPHIAFTGRLVHAKGIDDLLTASALLFAGFPTLRLSIIGEGPYRRVLERKARALSITHAVIFHGALDSEGVRDVLWQSDIFVNPSHSEGFPRCVLEALASGIAVVATDVGGTREIINDGVSGFLVPPRSPVALASKVAVLAQGAQLRARMSGEGISRSRDFSVEKMVEGHMHINGICAALRA